MQVLKQRYARRRLRTKRRKDSDGGLDTSSYGRVSIECPPFAKSAKDGPPKLPGGGKGGPPQSIEGGAQMRSEIHKSMLLRMELSRATVGLCASSEPLTGLDLIVIRRIRSKILDPDGMVVVAV